jgi:hypothetical protein
MQRNELGTAMLPYTRNNRRHQTVGADLCLRANTSKNHRSMRVGNNKDPNQKQPGEKQPGKFHYNPGNMSGKTAGTKKEDSERQSNADKRHERPDAQNKR